MKREIDTSDISIPVPGTEEFAAWSRDLTAKKYLAKNSRLKWHRIIFAILAILVGFTIGLYLSTAVHESKHFTVGQALALLPVPVDEYRPEPEPMPEPEVTSLGVYTVTAYCPCEVCCGKWSNPSDPKTASGTTPAELITVGADWDKLAPGTRLYIDGVGERVVEDKVAGWVSDKYDGRVLDLYFYDHQDAIDFGKQELDVWEVR